MPHTLLMTHDEFVLLRRQCFEGSMAHTAGAVLDEELGEIHFGELNCAHTSENIRVKCSPLYSEGDYASVKTVIHCQMTYHDANQFIQRTRILANLVELLTRVFSNTQITTYLGGTSIETGPVLDYSLRLLQD